MAIYEYRCEKCDGRFEALQPMGSKPLAFCGEQCVAESKSGKGPVVRLFSVANLLGNVRGADQPPPGCGQCDRFDPSTCH